MSTITATARSLVDRMSEATRGKWIDPALTDPVMIDPSSLIDLGELNGRHWWQHGVFGDLEEAPDFLTDADILPNVPVVQQIDDEGRRYRIFTIHPPETYARLVAVPTWSPKPPKANQPVDALAGAMLLTVQSGRDPVRRIRGAAAILDRIQRRGGVRLSIDGSALVISAPGGAPGNGLQQAVDLAAPLLIPFLRDGKPPTCAVTRHTKLTEANTVALGAPAGVPWCGSCSA